MRAPRIIAVLYLLALLLLPTALLSQQSGKDEKGDQGTTKLNIQVTSKRSQKPVKNAEVWVKSEEEDSDFDETLSTDRDGSARLSGVPRGTILIQVTAKGFQAHSKKYELSGDKAAISIELEVEASKEDKKTKDAS